MLFLADVLEIELEAIFFSAEFLADAVDESPKADEFLRTKGKRACLPDTK